MKFLIGRKQNMTQIFSEDGTVTPVTVVKTGPITITQVKTKEKDGYTAIQVGFGETHEKRLSKAVKGHTKGKNFALIKEFRVDDISGFNIGDVIDISAFSLGDSVRTISISKGKGFQGVVKRHGFAGGRRSHGQKHSEREPGSIGSGGVQRVFKNVRMAGRMGNDKKTENHKIVAIDKESGEVFIKGQLAGRRGTVVEMIG